MGIDSPALENGGRRSARNRFGATHAVPDSLSPGTRRATLHAVSRPDARRQFFTIVLVAVTTALVLINRSFAQQVTGMEASSFRVQLETYPPPNEIQIKTALEGSKAEPQSGGKILFWQPRLNRFTTNGVLELQARSENCIFDTMLHTVSSTNILQVEMASGRFYTEGQGFLRQTNGTIILSNQVHTVIRPARKPLKP